MSGVKDMDFIKKEYFEKEIPYPYRLLNGDVLEIHPFYMYDGNKFEDCYSILNYDKDNIPDVSILQMSYLQFLNECLFPTDDNYSNMLWNILSISLNCENIEIGTLNKRFVLKVSKTIISETEFDDIRRVILHQNIPKYDGDEYIDPDLKESYEDWIKAKNKDIDYPDLNKRILYVMANTSISKKEIFEMTYRTFLELFEVVKDNEEWKLNRAAELSGNVKFDLKLQNPLYAKDKSKYAAMFEEGKKMDEKLRSADGIVQK